MKGTSCLDTVIIQCHSIHKKAPSPDQALLVRGDALFILDFGPEILDAVGEVDFKIKSVSSKSFDKQAANNGILLHLFGHGIYIHCNVRPLKTPGMERSQVETLRIIWSLFLGKNFGSISWDSRECTGQKVEVAWQTHHVCWMSFQLWKIQH